MNIVEQRRYDISIDEREEAEEIWVKKTPVRGSHIRVNRGVYCHHGIYISDNEIIHFTGREGDNVLDWSKNEVIKTDIQYFLKGDTLQVKEYTDEELEDLYHVEHIVHYSRACLGEKGYNLFFNNCEHFANVCTLGRFRSRQVERVFDALIVKDDKIIRRYNEMGVFGRIGRAVKNFFSGGSSSSGGSRSVANTTYEPDKVKIAEIERETKLRLSQMENERIELMTNAKIDLLEKEYFFKIAYEEAKAKGFSHAAQTIVTMHEKLNEIAEKRLEIIERGSLSILKEIESFYGELEDKVKADNDNYNLKKFPILLETMQKFEKGSDAYNMYKDRIEKDADAQLHLMMKQFENLARRQSQIIDGFLESKNRIVDQTGKISGELLEKLSENNRQLELLNDKSHDTDMLQNNTRDMIASSKED